MYIQSTFIHIKGIGAKNRTIFMEEEYTYMGRLCKYN